MKVIKKFTRSICAVLIICMILVMCESTVFAKAVDSTKINMQQAVNLDMKNLIKWAKDNGFHAKVEVLKSGMKRVSVIKEDKKANIIKGLKNAGSKMIGIYWNSVKEEVDDLSLFDVLKNRKDLKAIANEIDEAATKKTVSSYGLSAGVDAFKQAYSNANMKEISVYYYQNENSSAVAGRVLVYSSLRPYGISAAFGKTDSMGRKIKKPDSTGLGYYYMQEKVTINKDKYWCIDVYPM